MSENNGNIKMSDKWIRLGSESTIYIDEEYNINLNELLGNNVQQLPVGYPRDKLQKALDNNLLEIANSENGFDEEPEIVWLKRKQEDIIKELDEVVKELDEHEFCLYYKKDSEDSSSLDHNYVTLVKRAKNIAINNPITRTGKKRQKVIDKINQFLEKVEEKSSMVKVINEGTKNKSK